MQAKLHHHGAHFYLYDSSRIQTIESGFFDPDWWARQDKLISQAQAGRGAAVFLNAGEHGWVLRHFRRGGLIAKLITDHYLWLGVEKSRAFREWRLLAAMHMQDLPVPRPIAAHVQRAGLAYQADLITARLPDAITLAEHLQKTPIDFAQWKALGALISRFHQAGVYHHDLNAHNIMRNAQGEFYLIDFDKGRLRAPGAWEKANCDRLLRSLRKLAGQYSGFAFKPGDWQALLQGYSGGAA